VRQTREVILTRAATDDNTTQRVRTSVATVSLSGTLAEKLEAIAGAGFDGFEVFEPDLVASTLRPAEVATRAADLGLTVDLYQPFRDLDSVDENRYRRSLLRAEAKLDLMAELGADMVLVCSSASPDAVSDDGRLAEQLHALAELASTRGVRVAYEALAWGTHVSTYRHSWDVVRRADHPALGICLDSFHILSRGDDPAGIRDIPGEKIFFLQLADAPLLGMDVLAWSRHYRCFPGQGGFDLGTFGAHVQAAGYRGPWSLEVFNDIFRHSATGRTAVDAHRSLLHIQELVGRRLASEGPGPSTRPVLFRPAEPPSVDGVVSLRIAAGPTGAAVGRELAALGFADLGAHREHALRLHRQGALAVVVDETEDTRWTAPESAAPLPRLSQLGVRSGEPAAWLARAQSLDVAAAEVSLPGAAPIDGTDVVRLRITADLAIDLRSPASLDSWQSTFAGAGIPAPPAGLVTGVDHVALAVGADQWDGAVLLLRSVFDMAPQPATELADLLGLVRSQAFTLTRDDGPALRIVLTMTPGSAGGGQGRPGGVSHVAFACPDVFAAATARRDAGAPFLQIPDNYYDDLATRHDLPAAELERMRELGLLYDTHPNGPAYGTLRHCFTPVVGEGLFFELVQREGNYDGYGGTSAAVRLAAQLARM